jgi:uracil phosphoribosyltransferase
VPEDLSDRQVYVLDPMLATGGTLVARSNCCSSGVPTTSPRSACSPRPRGWPRLEATFGSRDVAVTVVTAGLDERLNEKGYIVPGLGDAGDRLYGVV